MIDLKINQILNKIIPNKQTELRLCIDIGTHSLKIVLLESLSNEIKIIDYRILPLLDKNDIPQVKIINSIKKIKKQHLTACRNMYINLSGDNTFIRKLNLPPMEDKEIKNAAKWEIEEHTNFPIMEEHIKYQIIETTNQKSNEVIVAVISPKIADALTNIVKETNVNIKSVYLTPSSINNIIDKFIEIKNNEAVGILNIGFKESTINIYDKNGLQLTREISVTSDSMTNAITGKFNFKNKKIEISYKKAEEIKRNIGVPISNETDNSYDIPYSQIKVMLETEIERLSKEIKQSFNYFRFENNLDKEIKRLFICGGGGRLKNIESKLNEYLSFKVEKLTLPNNINFLKNDTSDYLQLSTAIGTSLSSNTKLNLLPKKVKFQYIKRISIASFRIFIIVLFFIIIWNILSLNIKINHYSKQLKHSELNTKTKEIQPMYEYIEKINNIKKKITINDIPIYLLLKTISNIIPETITLDELKLETEKQSLLFNGIISNQNGKLETELLKFKSKLGNLPFFNKVNLKKIRTNKNKNTATFIISCKLENL